MTDVITLSDLLPRRLHMPWYEGIAVVRDVAERLLQQPGPPRIPELHQIDLLRTGSVTLTGGVQVTEPVRRLGQLLQAMLTDAEAPVQLRLILSQATAPTPPYTSLTELDQALAYFERPDRAGLLTELFVRAEAAGPVTTGDAATLDRVAPLAATTPAVPVGVRVGVGSRRRSRLAAALIVILTVSGAVALYSRNAVAMYWTNSGMAANGRIVSRATTAAADGVGAVVMAGVSAVSDRAGLGRLVAADAPSTPPGPAAALPSAPRPRTRSSRPAAARLGPVSAGLEDLPPGTLLYDAPADEVSLPDAPRQPAHAPEPSADAPVDPVVYSVGSDGVSPPIGMRAQLPRRLPSTADPAKLSRIELIIARDGSVESARLLGSRRDVLGGMLLSAAKTWEFAPAMKDGVGVRYRKMILVSFE